MVWTFRFTVKSHVRPVRMSSIRDADRYAAAAVADLPSLRLIILA